MNPVCTALLAFVVSSPLFALTPGPALVVRQDRDRILQAAERALELPPVSLTQQRSPLSEGGPQDFFSMSDYYWPDPARPDGKPYVMRDGQSNPDNFNAHRQALMAMRDATAALAAAYLLERDERHARKAVEMLRVFFLDPATRMNPALEHAQAIVGKPTPERGTGLIDTLHLIEVPVSILALRGSKAMTEETFQGLRQWFAEYTRWFVTSPKGRNEAKAKNNHAVAYWLQVAAFATLLEDEALLAECRRQFKEVFVGVQMGEDGGFPLELGRTKPYAYSIFQLDNMALLCQLLSTQEDNLWTYTTADGRGMRRALAFMHPFLADKSTWTLKPDIHAWEGWPVRQPCLLFGGLAFQESKSLDLWRALKPDPQDFEIRRNNAITQPLLWTSLRPAPVSAKRLKAQDVFDLKKTVMFSDDFQDATLARWLFSEDDRYSLPAPSPERVLVVEAPGLPQGRKAVRFTVERAPNSFRSEISLPSEKGFQERWYAARIQVPEDWVWDPQKAQDIVMQWHGVPGNWKPTHPNLAISISHDKWFIKRSWGSPQEGPARQSHEVKEPVLRGTWTSWVIHARWSPGEDGLLQIWKDGRLVLEEKGPNVYGTIGVEYTPYLKTGIYRPEWHVDTERKRKAFESQPPVPARKVIYVTEVKIGGPETLAADFLPASTAASFSKP